MANADSPSGFRPVGNLLGAPHTAATRRCVILAADSTATFIGDLVTLSGTASSDGNAYPSVQQAAVDDKAFGVITSFEADPTNLELMYRTASTLRYCNVVPCTGGQLFAIQADSVSHTEAITDIGNTADFIVGSGNTSTGKSGMELDSSSIGTGVGLHIMGIVPRPDNAIGDNVEYIVRVNENAFGGTGTGA